MNADSTLLTSLKARLQKSGYQVTSDKDSDWLVINGTLKVAGTVIEHPAASPKIMQLQISVLHDVLFPGGIIENLVGFGDTLEEKIESGLDNYFSTTLPSIIESVSSSNGGEFDYRDTSGVLWHSSVGNMATQGQWESNIFDEPIFRLLKPHLIQMNFINKVNWVKVYISRQSDGSVMGECLLNNSPWESGYGAVAEYASHWGTKGRFLGQKQFMVFRRCDMHDK